MSKIFLIIGAFAGFCFVALLAALHIGRSISLPNELRVIGFSGDCQNKPCIWGLTPGQSQWTDVLTTYGDYITQDKKRAIVPVISTGFGGEMMLIRSAEQQFLGRVQYFAPMLRGVGIGWVLQQFGPPCAITIYTGQITYRYPKMLFNVTHDRKRLYYQAKVISFYIDDPHAKEEADLCVDRTVTPYVYNRPWRGFTTVIRYLAP
jgi:hypothetical protein